ncbi:tetratricopeptide repeat protein 1 [Gastrophryne carolinensis]
MEMREPDPDTKEEETGASNVMEGEPEEEELLEMEKHLTEDERQDRRKESTRLKEEGNTLFKNTDYVAAEEVYSQALQTCPAFYKKDRSILFSNRAAARLKQDKKDFALKDCTKAIELNPDYVRALLRRAELYEKTEKLDEALADYQAILQRDPSCYQAREACMRLPKQIEERNEKMKEEMMSKLKDLGNLVLKPFGLSTNNFQVNQDPQTGSYSINFVQNNNR